MDSLSIEEIGHGVGDAEVLKEEAQKLGAIYNSVNNNNKKNSNIIL